MIANITVLSEGTILVISGNDCLRIGRLAHIDKLLVRALMIRTKKSCFEGPVCAILTVMDCFCLTFDTRPNRYNITQTATRIRRVNIPRRIPYSSKARQLVGKRFFPNRLTCVVSITSIPLCLPPRNDSTTIVSHEIRRDKKK